MRVGGRAIRFPGLPLCRSPLACVHEGFLCCVEAYEKTRKGCPQHAVWCSEALGSGGFSALRNAVLRMRSFFRPHHA